MSQKRVYIDHNATTPVFPEVIDTVAQVLAECGGNPSSTHRSGRHSKQRLDEARASVARSLGARPGEIVFTASGSEANNLAVFGTARRAGRGRVVTSNVEHPSVASACDKLEHEGFSVTRVPVGSDGRIDTSEFVGALKGDDVVLATLIHAQNETGILQPVRSIGNACRDRAIPFHTDTAQSAGKISLHAAKDPFDMMTVVGHKLHAPKGIAALFRGRDAVVDPIIVGGGQEHGLRPGTENIALAAGFAKALEIMMSGREKEAARVRGMRDHFEEEITRSLEGVFAVGAGLDRLPGTSLVLFEGIFGGDMAEALDSAGLEVSTGSACHSGSPEPSAVLTAMGIEPALAVGAVRVGFGKGNEMDHADRLVEEMIRITEQLRS